MSRSHRHPRRLARRAVLAASVGGTALLALAGPAAAHVGTSVDEVAAGGTADLGLTIGHGCDGSSTTTVAVQLPEGVDDASAFAKPGWTVTTEREALAEPVARPHGDPLTERVAVITFTAQPGNALPDALRDTFTIHFTAPDTPGETLAFKTVQTCEVGELAWIELADASGEEPESPAPTVAVVEGDGGDDHGHGGASSHADDEVAAEPAASTGDDDGGDGLAVAGIVLGSLGLLTGGAALARGRRAG